MKLIITRPAEDGRRQAAQLKQKGHDAVVRPLMEIVYQRLTPLRLQGVQGLIVTSRNALRGLAHNGAFDAAKRLPAYCVGETTASFARSLGFEAVVTGPGTAKELLPLIVKATRPEVGALLYLTGKHLAFDLETPLKDRGFAVPRLILYEAREADVKGLEAFAETFRAGVDGVVLMSARTSEVFVKAVKAFKLEREAAAATCYCYSAGVAVPLRELGTIPIALSPRPTETDLMELIGPTVTFHSRALAELQEALGKR